MHLEQRQAEACHQADWIHGNGGRGDPQPQVQVKVDGTSFCRVRR
jgi:hypothetical protein